MSIHAMTIEIEPQGFRATFRASCSAPAANCHYVCAEGCETWGPIIRNEAGAVMGHAEEGAGVGEPLHRMTHVDECNYVGFLENSDDLTEDMEGEPVRFTVPAEFIFHGDYVTWKATTS